jgi:hypothetical protein
MLQGKLISFENLSTENDTWVRVSLIHTDDLWWDHLQSTLVTESRSTR